MLLILSWLLLGLSGAQAAVMAVDEFIFHRRRGLQRFERWGHVADTSVFFLALMVPALLRPSPAALLGFAGLALFSCLFITKDEWIHSQACQPIEQWCHALLFLLHGPILLLIGLLWYLEPNLIWLKALPLLVAAWGLYQLFYWNVYHVRKHDQAVHQQ